MLCLPLGSVFLPSKEVICLSWMDRPGFDTDFGEELYECA